MRTEQAVTTLKVDLHPISIDESGLKQLYDIVLKAAEQDPSAYVKFEIEGKTEVVEGESIESLVSARLPRDLSEITLRASSDKNSRTINLYISDIGSGFMTYSNIEISGKDIDWVSARVKELEGFISDHRNFHWIFQNWISVGIQAVILGMLIAYSLWGAWWSILTAFLISYFYIPIVRKIFPAVVLDTKRQSGLKTVRKILVYVIPLTVVGLLLNLLSRLIWPS